MKIKLRFWVLALTFVAIMGCMVTSVAGSTITGAKYIGKMTVRNTSYSASAFIPFTMNTDTMINGNFLNSNFNNVSVIGPNGSDLCFMPARSGASTWLVWQPTVPQNSVATYSIYTGGPIPMGGLIRYFPDTAGMSVNDAANLELGSNFSIETKGYFDTAAGASKNITSKSGSCLTTVSGASQITTTLTMQSLLSTFSTASDGQAVSTGQVYATVQAAATGTATSNGATLTIGQSANTANQTQANSTGGAVVSSYSGYPTRAGIRVNGFQGTLTSVGFYLNKNSGATASAGYCRVYNVSGGALLGTLGSFTGSSLPSVATLTAFTTPVVVSSSTDIYIVIEYTGAASNIDTVLVGGLYGSGNAWSYSLSRYDGASWADTTSEDMGYNITYVTNFTINRAFLYFDTSSIPAGATITAASLGLYGAADNSTTDFNITVSNGQATYPHVPLVAADFNKTNYSGTGGTLTTSGYSVAGYNILTLDATGKTWINKGGTTKLELVSSRDLAGTVPTGNEYVSFYANEQAGTSQDPTLTVTYTADYSSIATGVASGDHTITVALSGNSLTTTVDGIVKDTDIVAGAVIDNANAWTFFQTGCVPVVEYAKITVGGTLKGHWIWQGAATFTDQSGNNNTATPTFRTTGSSAFITGTLDSFGALVPSTFGGSPGGGTNLIDTADMPIMPASWYSSLHAILPWQNQLNDLGIPPSWFWLNMAFFTVVLAMFFGFWMSKDLLAMDIAGGTMAASWAIWIGLSLWIFVPLGAVWFGELVRRRVVSL